jgi:PAS domain-containing protein
LADTGGSFSPRIIDSLLNAVVIVDSGGRVLYANLATEQLPGWPVVSLFGTPFIDLIPERFQSRYSAAFNRLIRTTPPRASYAPARVVMRRLTPQKRLLISAPSWLHPKSANVSSSPCFGT